MRRTLMAALVAACAAAIPAAGRAQDANAAVERFYKGKTVNLYVANSGGGRYDLNAHLVARHLGRFIPGEPNVVVQNLTGGGGLVMANRMYNTADRDGATLAVLQPGAAQTAIQGVPTAKFDPTKFNWLGSVSSFGDDADLLIVSPNHPARSALDLRKGMSATLGSGTPGSTNLTFALLGRDALGLDLKIVRGYNTAPFVPMEAGEIDGQVVLMSSIKSTHPDFWKTKSFTPLAQFGRVTRHPELPDVPTARELVVDPANMPLLEFAELAFFMSMPVIAPPGVPPERLAALRKAFDAMTRDPEFRDEATRMGVDLSPIDGDAVLSLIRKAAATPKAVIARYNEIVPPGE